MGLFDKALKTAKNVGNSALGAAANVGSSIGTSAQDNSELASLKMQVNTIEQELDAAYLQVGKKFIGHVIQTGETGGLDVADLLKMMEPKLERKEELEKQIMEVEKRMKQNDLLREKANAQKKFEDEKGRLDKALAMDVISKEEYDTKIAVAQKKFDNFEQIRKIEQQYDMKLISKEERNEKIKALTE